MTTEWVELSELMVSKAGSVDPKKFGDEKFELFSIPAFDRGASDLVLGSEIGSNKQIVRPGDLMLSKIVPHIRRAWIVPACRSHRQIASGEWILFRSPRIHGPYLRHLLTSDYFNRQFMQTVAGVGGSLLRARPSHVAKIRVPLPPLDEQRRIAAILDKADELRTKRRQAILHLDALTQSIFQSIFGDLTNEQHIPLRDAVAPGTIVTYGIVQAGDEYPSGVPYVRTGDIRNGRIDHAGLRRTNPAIAAKFARSRITAGDIVMSIRATVGTVALTPPELDGANLTQGTARIAPGPETEASYLLEYLRTPRIQQWIQKQVKGATFKEITLDRLRQLPVSIPKRADQLSFGHAVSAVEKLKGDHHAQLSDLDTLFASLQHRAFKGEL